MLVAACLSLSPSPLHVVAQPRDSKTDRVNFYDAKCSACNTVAMELGDSVVNIADLATHENLSDQDKSTAMQQLQSLQSHLSSLMARIAGGGKE